MPIQNIDNFLMPNRSQEASILKFHGDNKIPAEQQSLTSEVNSRAEKNLTRTNETKETETRDQGFDARKKGSNEYFLTKKKKKKEKAKSPSPSKKLQGPEGRTIDIKL